jgi:hypothetical protein
LLHGKVWLGVLRMDGGFARTGLSGQMINNNAASAEDYVSLYRRAFAEFGASAPWSSRPVPVPTPADALAIAHSLRVESDLEARRLAERIEQACRAAV